MVASLNGHAPAVELPAVEIPNSREATLRDFAPPFVGTEVRVYTSVTVRRMLEILRTDREDTPEPTLYLYEQRLQDFARYNLIAWNLVRAKLDADGYVVLDEAGQRVLEPIPPTYDSLMNALPREFVKQVLAKFAEEVAGVPRPLGNASASGSPSQAQPETTEPPSSSRRSSRKRK